MEAKCSLICGFLCGLIGRLEGATTDNCSADLEHVLDKFLH